MTAAAIVLVFVLLFAIVGSLVLYYFVRAEHDQRETMNRQEAERTARRDTRERE